MAFLFLSGGAFLSSVIIDIFKRLYVLMAYAYHSLLPILAQLSYFINQRSTYFTNTPFIYIHKPLCMYYILSYKNFTRLRKEKKKKNNKHTFFISYSPLSTNYLSLFFSFYLCCYLLTNRLSYRPYPYFHLLILLERQTIIPEVSSLMTVKTYYLVYEHLPQ